MKAKRTTTDTTATPWLVSRPEGFYYRVRVVGKAMEEIGPFKTKAEAIDGHTLAMGLYDSITVGLLNGDAAKTYRWFHDPIGLINEILAAVRPGVAPLKA